MAKERVKTIPIDPFGYSVEVIVTTDFEYSLKKRRDILGDIETKDNAFAFTCLREGQSKAHLFCPPDSSIGTIAHECLHIVAFVMREIGAQFEEEIWAYFVGELAEKVAIVAWPDRKG